jgi:antitoxin component of MazEF toxin-antitoxin module
MEEDTIKFEVKAIDIGGSTYTLIPKPLLNWLQLQNGDPITITGKTNKHGKQAIFWKKENPE